MTIRLGISTSFRITIHVDLKVKENRSLVGKWREGEVGSR